MINRNRYDFILDDFESHYKYFYDKMIDWYAYGYYEIIAILNNGARLIYNQMSGSIRFIKDDEHELSEDEWTKSFSVTLKQKVSTKGLTQKDLSDATGISKVSISKYMSGKSIPSYYNMIKIAQVLDCSVSEFGYF